MKICILEIVPSKRINNIEIFNDYDHYFITYKKFNKDAIKFNKNKSWAENRNDLYKYAKNINKYDYYMFIDYDIILKHNISTNKSIMEDIILKLTEYKPIMYRMSGFNDDLKIRSNQIVGGFINHSVTILRHDVMDYIFPLPTKYGGFWESASWINTLIIPFFNKSVIVDYDIIGVNTESGKYTHNIDPQKGIEAMSNLFNETKKIFKFPIPENILEFKYKYKPSINDDITQYIKIDNIKIDINKEELDNIKMNV